MRRRLAGKLRHRLLPADEGKWQEEAAKGLRGRKGVAGLEFENGGWMRKC
jgi:hypothetical protein